MEHMPAGLRVKGKVRRQKYGRQGMDFPRSPGFLASSWSRMLCCWERLSGPWPIL
jgi:hypothetical protein